MDKKIFDNDLHPWMAEQGFGGIFCGKFRQAQEWENVKGESTAEKADDNAKPDVSIHS